MLYISYTAIKTTKNYSEVTFHTHPIGKIKRYKEHLTSSGGWGVVAGQYIRLKG